MDATIKETKEKMEKSIEAFQNNLSTVRTGRANPAIFNRVNVDYYGSMTPLNQLATINSPDPRTILITPFDKTAIETIEKAIQDSDLGLNPNNKGDAIFITVPALNDERRRDLVKTTKNMGEEAKISLRSIRRDANSELKEMQKENLLTEDDVKKGEGDVQKLTDDFVSQIDEQLKSKEADIMEV